MGVLFSSTDELFSTPTYAKMRHFAQSPGVSTMKSSVIAEPATTRDAYMSPLLASDEQLSQFCPVYFIVSLLSCWFWWCL